MCDVLSHTILLYHLHLKSEEIQIEEDLYVCPVQRHALSGPLLFPEIPAFVHAHQLGIRPQLPDANRRGHVA